MNVAVTLRIASASDVPAIHRLISDNIEVGHLLPRTIEDVERHASRFVAASFSDVSADDVIACAELAPLSDGVAEVRSLVVAEAYRGRGIGTRLVRQVAAAAASEGFSTLCAFTHEPSHFVRMGFTIVPHTWVPQKIAHDCTACSLFRRCGQYAVTFALRANVRVRPEQPAAVIHGSRTVQARRLPLRPVAAEPEPAEAVPA